MIASSQTDEVLTLTLNRPEKRNALSAELVQTLTDGLESVANDESLRVVVLTGAGSAFSAGADLSALQKLQDASVEENLHDSEQLARLFAAIVEHPLPIVAKINGHAIAGGCGLAAACDYSIASEEAKLGFTEVKIGFVPAIVSVIATRKMGEAVARDLLLSGRLIAAEEAAGIGLITRAVTAERLDAEVEAVVEALQRTSKTAVALTKRLLRDVQGMGFSEGISHAARLNALARMTDDCREGIATFLERRTPNAECGTRKGK